MITNHLPLYEKLGGESGIAALAIAFYVRVLADPELNHFFKDTSVERLHAIQRKLFNIALGGPVKYSGSLLAKAHHGRGITAHHFNLFVGHLLATLKGQDIDEVDRSEIINRVNGYANEII